MFLPATAFLAVLTLALSFLTNTGTASAAEALHADSGFVAGEQSRVDRWTLPPPVGLSEALLADPVALDLFNAIKLTGIEFRIVANTWDENRRSIAGQMGIEPARTWSTCALEEGRCLRVVIEIQSWFDLSTPTGRIVLRHELAHALSRALRADGKDDNLGHPRPTTFEEAYRLAGARGIGEPPAWYCWAANQPWKVVIINGLGISVADDTPEARAEWTACEVARTGVFR